MGSKLSKTIEAVIEDYCKENDLDSDVIKKVYLTQFKFFKKSIENNPKRPVRLPKFGIFSLKSKKIYQRLQDGDTPEEIWETMKKIREKKRIKYKKHE